MSFFNKIPSSLDATLTEKVSGAIRTFTGRVFAVAEQSDGKVLFGGDFKNYNGDIGKNHLIRLNADFTEDTEFTNNAVRYFVGGQTDPVSFFNDTIHSICVQPDGKILIGGSFTDHGGITNRNRFIRLNPDGTLDTPFTSEVTGEWGASPDFFQKIDNTVRTIDYSADRIYIGGDFSNYGGFGWRYLVAMDFNGVPDFTFNNTASLTGGGTDFNNGVFKVLVLKEQSTLNGEILVAGIFTNYRGITGNSYITRLTPTGTLSSLNAAIVGKCNNIVYAVMEQPGYIYLGGTFTDYDATTNLSRFVRLLANTMVVDVIYSANASIGLSAPKFSSRINYMSKQSDGKVVLVTWGNYEANYAPLVRLNVNGFLDTDFFNSSVGTGVTRKINGFAYATLVRSNGQVIVTTDDIRTRSEVLNNFVALLDTNGININYARKPLINNGSKFSGRVRDSLYFNGNHYFGGPFGNYAGVTGVSRLIKVNSKGVLDSSFMANAVNGAKFSGEIWVLLKTPDNGIIVGGSFVGYAGVPVQDFIVKLNEDGTPDTTFNNNVNGKFANTIKCGAVQPDGKILLGGGAGFYLGGASGKQYLIRLNADGTEDTSFTDTAVRTGTTPKFNGEVTSIAVGPFNIFVTGAFTNYGAAIANNFFVALTLAGGYDTTFNSNAVVAPGPTARFNAAPTFVSVQADGKVLVAGGFTNYNVANASYAIRLNSNGTSDTIFRSLAVTGRFNASVNAMREIQNGGGPEDGNIVITGNFTNYGGLGYNYAIYVNSDGILLDTKTELMRFTSPPTVLKPTQDGLIPIAFGVAPITFSPNTKLGPGLHEDLIIVNGELKII